MRPPNPFPVREFECLLVNRQSLMLRWQKHASLLELFQPVIGYFFMPILLIQAHTTASPAKRRRGALDDTYLACAWLQSK
jgi:hypothetical protein